MAEPQRQPADDPHAEALRLAALGLRVLPIAPGHKYPHMKEWQDAATTDAATINGWFTGLYRGHGVGVATGRVSAVFVLDVDVSGEKCGDDTLFDLERDHGPLPDTVTAQTGSGGWHHYFAWPATGEIRNEASSKLGPGLDIRGEGGQVLAPPTIHPNGTAYRWLEGHAPGEIDVAPAPYWLLDLLQEPKRKAASPTPPRSATSTVILGGEDGPAARFNASCTWDDLLTADGWELTDVDDDGEQHWRRPLIYGPTDSESGATVGYKGADMLRVFTTSVPWLPAAAYSRFGYYACRDHHGDRSAAAKHLRWLEFENQKDCGLDDIFDAPARVQTEQPTQPQPEVITPDEVITIHGWERVHLSEYRGEGYEPPVPTILRRSDGMALFYIERMNNLQGESGSGKSWVALGACAEVLMGGGTTIYVDLEDHPRSIDDRLAALGVPYDIIDERFIYLRPDTAIMPEALDYVDNWITSTHALVVVIDSVGEAMALQGLKQNDDDEVARWMRRLPRRWARLGPAIILIDHVVKDADSRGLYAIGSQRKRAAIDGAAYRVDQVKAFAKGTDGVMRLVVAKDRNGTYPNGSTAAEITVGCADDGSMSLAIAPSVSLSETPGIGGVKRTILAERISRWLEGQVGPRSGRDVTESVPGKGQALRAALDEMVAARYLDVVEGPKRAQLYTVANPFRQDDLSQLVGDSEGSRDKSVRPVSSESVRPQCVPENSRSELVRPSASPVRPPSEVVVRPSASPTPPTGGTLGTRTLASEPPTNPAINALFDQPEEP